MVATEIYDPPIEADVVEVAVVKVCMRIHMQMHMHISVPEYSLHDAYMRTKHSICMYTRVRCMCMCMYMCM